MKRGAFIAGLALVAAAALGQTYNQTATPNMAYATYTTNLTFSGSTTNPVLTVEADGCLYQTFHIYNTGTNPVIYELDRTLDGTNWLLGATNGVTTNSLVETNFAAKELFLRIKLVETNGAGGINYMGGR